LLEAFPIRPAVLPFQGVGAERLGLKGRKSAMAKICQERAEELNESEPTDDVSNRAKRAHEHQLE
jgi:hypothetical protein